jgi:hypothetical protein
MVSVFISVLFMLKVANKSFMLSVIMLNVVAPLKLNKTFFSIFFF